MPDSFHLRALPVPVAGRGPAGVLAAAGLALALLAGVAPEARAQPAAGRVATPDAQAVERLVVEKTNAFRLEHGLAALSPEASLDKAARYFAQHMARTDTHSHTADGKEPVERAREHGYDHCIVLENLAFVFNSRGFRAADLAAQYVEGWKESAGHRRNLLDGAVTDIGVAVARSDRSGRWYAVQMFGRPRSRSVRFAVRNAAPRTVRYRVGDEAFTLAPRTTHTHTQCRSGSVHLDGEPGAAPLAARNGDKFAIVGRGGGLALRRE